MCPPVSPVQVSVPVRPRAGGPPAVRLKLGWPPAARSVDRDRHVGVVDGLLCGARPGKIAVVDGRVGEADDEVVRVRRLERHRPRRRRGEGALRGSSCHRRRFVAVGRIRGVGDRHRAVERVGRHALSADTATCTGVVLVATRRVCGRPGLPSVQARRLWCRARGRRRARAAAVFREHVVRPGGGEGCGAAGAVELKSGFWPEGTVSAAASIHRRRSQSRRGPGNSPGKKSRIVAVYVTGAPRASVDADAVSEGARRGRMTNGHEDRRLSPLLLHPGGRRVGRVDLSVLLRCPGTRCRCGGRADRDGLAQRRIVTATSSTKLTVPSGASVRPRPTPQSARTEIGLPISPTTGEADSPSEFAKQICPVPGQPATRGLSHYRRAGSIRSRRLRERPSRSSSPAHTGPGNEVDW